MAGLVSNTSMTPDNVLDLSVPQVEGILEGIQRLNSTDESKGTTNRLEDADALKFILSNGGNL